MTDKKFHEIWNEIIIPCKTILLNGSRLLKFRETDTQSIKNEYEEVNYPLPKGSGLENPSLS